MISNAEAAAERLDRRAAETASPAGKERFRAKAAKERRNAEHHRQLLAAIVQGSIIGF